MGAASFRYTATYTKDGKERTDTNLELLIDIDSFDVGIASYTLAKNIEKMGGYTRKSWKSYKIASDTLDAISKVGPDGLRTKFYFSEKSPVNNKIHFDTLTNNIQAPSEDNVFNQFIAALSKVTSLDSKLGEVPPGIVTMLNTLTSVSGLITVSKVDSGSYVHCKLSDGGIAVNDVKYLAVSTPDPDNLSIIEDSRGIQNILTVVSSTKNTRVALNTGEVGIHSIFLKSSDLPSSLKISTQIKVITVSKYSSATTYNKSSASQELDTDTVLFGGKNIKAADFYDELGGRPYNDGIGGRNSGNSELKRDAFTLDFFDPITKRTVPIASNWNAVGGSTDIFGVQLGIYPDSLQVSSSKVISRQMTFTRWVEEHWGDDLDSLSFSGSSFGFYSKEDGITSFYRENSGSYKEMQAFSNFVLLNGIIYQEDASEWVSMAKQDFSNPTTNRNAVKTGLTQMLGATPTTFWLKSSSYSTAGRRETEYTLPERFLTPMISKGRVNGFTMQSLKKHPRAGMIKARYPVRISHGATQFLGFFESFDVSENADSPFKFSYSATFKVEKIISTKGY